MLQARSVYSILIGKHMEEHGGLRNNIKRNRGEIYCRGFNWFASVPITMKLSKQLLTNMNWLNV